MSVRPTTVSINNTSEKDRWPFLDTAVRLLRRGALVVYPTDTLWALGALATHARAVRFLYRVKKRPTTLPVSLAVSSMEEGESWTSLRPEDRVYLRRVLPGPVTVLLPPSQKARRRLSPLLLTKGGVGLRVPDHWLARELARRAGPLTCTSANIHGRPPGRHVSAIRNDLGAHVALYLTASPLPRGVPSRIVDRTGKATVLRHRKR